MTTYFYGNIEFGRFSPQLSDDSYPLAIIHSVNEVKDFDSPEEAWQYYVNSNGDNESYVSLDAEDENGVQYELVFKQHR